MLNTQPPAPRVPCDACGLPASETYAPKPGTFPEYPAAHVFLCDRCVNETLKEYGIGSLTVLGVIGADPLEYANQPTWLRAVVGLFEHDAPALDAREFDALYRAGMLSACRVLLERHARLMVARSFGVNGGVR